jgi:hypothetical protein
MPRIRVLLTLLLVSITLSGCGIFGGGKKTIVQITNKITSLPAGQFYQFMANVQHNQKSGVTVSLTGAGTLVLDSENQSAYYIAPPAPPSPNSVTVTVTAGNGSGASDSDTFTITPAAGPVVSITPAAPTVSASSGTPVTLNIAVTMDSSSDTLTPSVTGSSACSGGVCGSFGEISGTPGSGVYTVEYSPPSSVTASTIQQISINSSLASSTNGTAFVTINP